MRTLDEFCGLRQTVCVVPSSPPVLRSVSISAFVAIRSLGVDSQPILSAHNPEEFNRRRQSCQSLPALLLHPTFGIYTCFLEDTVSHCQEGARDSLPGTAWS